MCGFAGYWNPNASPRLNPDEVLQALAHRGPDAQGVYFDGHVHLLHSRLAVQDVSEAANQPMCSSDGNAVLVYNGELYNTDSLRKKLAAHEVIFSTTSDTEVLLYWLLHKGAEGLKDLNGCYALAFYQKDSGSLLLARDPMGIKPLYIREDAHGVRFASEASVLLDQNEGFRKEGLAQFLSLTFELPDQPLFESVRSLKPGEVWQSNSVSTSIPFAQDSPTKPLLKLLNEAVERRLVSDVPLGAFLSGGIDSATICALAVQHRPDLQTFSLGFAGKGLLDERAAAARTAKALGTDHHEIELHESDMLHSMDDWLHSLDLPFGDASALAVYHLSKFARQQVTVALSGDGADELFGGYRRYAGWMRAKEMNPLAQRVARSSLGQSTERLQASREHAMGLRIHGLQKFVHVLSLPLAKRYAFLTRFVQPQTVARVFQTACPSLAKPESLSDVLLHDQASILPGDMLVKVDRMSMAHGLEVRVPFLDPNVVAASRLLPENMRVRGGETKWALRQAVQSLLPKEVLEAPKHGFEIPMERWLTGPLASDVQHHLQPEYFTTQEGWIPDGIVQVRDAFFKKPTPELTHLVWNLWVLRRWLSR